MLVDTSVWVDHFRTRNALLSERLELDVIWTHPFVIGELACGNLSSRSQILRMLKALHSAPLVEHDEVLLFIEDRKLNGLGLGWVDMHLLASAYAAKLSIWAFDTQLTAVAQELDLASPP